MSIRRRIQLSPSQQDELKKRQAAAKPQTQRNRSPSAALPPVDAAPTSLSTANVLQLQRAVGNRATTQLLTTEALEQAPAVQRSAKDETDDQELPCPGSKINSAGLGLGTGRGQGQGPIGVPLGEKDEAS